MKKIILLVISFICIYVCYGEVFAEAVRVEILGAKDVGYKQIELYEGESYQLSVKTNPEEYINEIIWEADEYGTTVTQEGLVTAKYSASDFNHWNPMGGKVTAAIHRNGEVWGYDTCYVHVKVHPDNLVDVHVHYVKDGKVIENPSKEITKEIYTGDYHYQLYKGKNTINNMPISHFLNNFIEYNITGSGPYYDVNCTKKVLETDTFTEETHLYIKLEGEYKEKPKEEVFISELEVDPQEINGNKGETATITIIKKPAGTTPTFKSCNTKVVTVDKNGKCTFVGKGMTKILITAGEWVYSILAECNGSNDEVDNTNPNENIFIGLDSYPDNKNNQTNKEPIKKPIVNTDTQDKNNTNKKEEDKTVIDEQDTNKDEIINQDNTNQEDETTDQKDTVNNNKEENSNNTIMLVVGCTIIGILCFIVLWKNKQKK